MKRARTARAKWLRTLAMAVISFVLLTSVSFAQTTLSVLMQSWASSTPIWQELLQRFEAENPDITLELTYGDYETMVAQMAAGMSPDVFHHHRFMGIEGVYQGHFAPIDAYLEIVGIDMETWFIPPTLNESIFRGLTYSVPFDTDIRALFYNVDHLNDSGLDGSRGPQTWDELNEYARLLTRYNDSGNLRRVGFLPWAGNWGFRQWFAAFGGDHYDPESHLPTVDRPENVLSTEWQVSYAEQYGRPIDLGAFNGYTSSFPGGTLSMVAAHDYIATTFRETNPTLNFWATPVPHPPGGRNGTVMGGYAFYVPIGDRSGKEEAIARFLRFMADPDVQFAYYQARGAIPTAQAGVTRLLETADDLHKVFLAQIHEALWPRPFDRLMIPVVNAEIQKALNLEKSALAALEDAQHTLMSQYADIWEKKL